jgi:glutathione synthase/RimK-type ligase-like ATP-grasp enzyme
MNLRVLGVYREVEFSPGKIGADRAIMDAVLAELRASGASVNAVPAASFALDPLPAVDLVLAMCQGAPALNRLAVAAQAGALTINSALAIRNCYRDLLGPGLTNARVPAPEGVLIRTGRPIDWRRLRPLALNAPMYVKRGDLHALAGDDVQRVVDAEQLKNVLIAFGERGIDRAYVQQEVAGTVVKFYGVGLGDEYFSTLAPEGFFLSDALQRELRHAGGVAAAALGLEIWGGDAIFDHDRYAIVDFNDWPSFERVRDLAAPAIARRCLALFRSRQGVALAAK